MLIERLKQRVLAPRGGRTGSGEDDTVRMEASLGPDGGQQGKGTLRERPEGGPQDCSGVRRVRRHRFRAFLTERQFSRDLAFALWLPLVLAAFAVRSCDAPGAAPGTCEATKWRGLALSSFPCGAHVTKQLLHVLRHLPWYLLVRPVRVGDWAGLLSNAHHLAFTGLVLVLAAARRQGRLWNWWRRHRVLAAWSTARGGSTLLHLASYPLLPRARWPDAVFGPYTLLVSTHPVASTLIYCALDLFVGLPFLPAFAGILLHMGIVWVASYTVAPTITHLEQQRSAAAGTGGPAVSSSFAFGSALDCGNPRIAALVSCRPVWQQCVVAAFLVAFPAVFAAASQGWLWGRFRKAPAGQQLQRQEQQLRGAQQQLHTLGPHSAQVPQQPLGPMGDAGWPAAAGGTDPAPLGDPMYQSRVRSRTVSIKVLQHPGSHEEFGPRLAVAVQRAVLAADREVRVPVEQQQWEQKQQHTKKALAAGDVAGPSTSSPTSRAQGGRGPTRSAEGPYAVCTMATVVRGCTQLLLLSGLLRRDELLPRRQQQPRGRMPDPNAPASGGSVSGEVDASGLGGVENGSSTSRGGGNGAGSGSGSEGGGTEAHRVPRGTHSFEGQELLSATSSSRSSSSAFSSTSYTHGAGAAGQPSGSVSPGPRSPDQMPSGEQGETWREQQRQQEDAEQLAGRLLSAVSGLGRVSGVCVQVGCGGVLSVLGTGGNHQHEQVAVEHAVSSAATVQLLRCYPPALALPTRGSGEGDSCSRELWPAGEEGVHGQEQRRGHGDGRELGPAQHGTLRLLLSSPVPQEVRVVVARAEAEGRCSREVAEFPLQLRGGEQEVEMQLSGLLQTMGGAGTHRDQRPLCNPPPEVLQLMLLPPVHGTDAALRREEDSWGDRDSDTRPSSGLVPSLHFAAPLLLLPAEAATELCALDDRMRTASAATGSEAPLVSYWRAHMGPLLCDIAMLLRAGASARGGDSGGSDISRGGSGRPSSNSSSDGVGAEDSGDHGLHDQTRDEGAGEMLSLLLPELLAFLRGQHMSATERAVLCRTSQPVPPPGHLSSTTPPLDRGGQGQGPAGDSHDSSSDPATFSAVHDSTRPSVPASAPMASGSLDASHPCPRHLVRGFRPPALERDFRIWRAAGLAKAALPLMLLAAVPHLYALGASVWWLLSVRQGSVTEGWVGPGLLQAGSGAAFYFGSWAADVAGYVAVLVVAGAIARRGPLGGAKGQLIGRKLENTTSKKMELQASHGVPVAAPLNLDTAYTVGAVAVGPLLLLLLAAVALLLQPDLPNMVNAGGHGTALAVAATRAVTCPCVQQLAARQVVWATPVLVLGEALLLGVLRPRWSNAKVWGVAAGWRVVALVLSVGFEWRARKRFLLDLGAGS